MMKPKKRKGSKLVILSPALRILKLHKRCISVRKQCLNKESSRSKGPLVPCRAIQQRSIKQLKGPLVPCGTIQQMSIELNDEQLKEALLSARFALHKYSATADDVFTDVRFSRLVSASAVFDEKEKCYTYLMTIEGNDHHFYDAHILYKQNHSPSADIFGCFFIRPSNSISN